MKQKVSARLKKHIGRKNFSRVKKMLDLVISYKKSTYSQFGEDLFLEKYFKDVPAGMFVDVGAYHPRQFSNTYALYKKGWRGVNIDATPGSMKLFNLLRPGDSNREYAVSNSKTPVKLSVWGTDSENTVHRDHSQAVEGHKGAPVSVVEMEPKSLTEILQTEKQIPKNFEVLSVDVEGWDHEVLQSLDWNLYSPKVVLVEVFATSIDEAMSSPLYAFMKDKGYTLTAWYNPTLIFSK